MFCPIPYVRLPVAVRLNGINAKCKRKSEVYLTQEKKDVRYTIVHPGGLLNEPGGEQELVVVVDDDFSYGNTNLLEPFPEKMSPKLCWKRYAIPKFMEGGRSFDLRAKAVGEGQLTNDFETLFDSLDWKNCDYTLGETMREKHN
jgi:hypothetical protein